MSSNNDRYPVSGAGLGLRRGLLDKMLADPPAEVDFLEVAPEAVHLGARSVGFEERGIEDGEVARQP